MSGQLNGNSTGTQPRRVDMPRVQDTNVDDVRQRYILHLSASPRRTVVNTYNLALMSRLAYDEGAPIAQFVNTRLGNKQRGGAARDRIALAFAWRFWPVLRRVDAAHAYDQFDASQHFVSVGSTQLFMASCEQHALISFRGTSALNDIAIDAEFPSVPCPNGRMHKGFRDAYHAVRSRLRAFVARNGRTLSGAQKPIFICGHSLGAALAAIAACDLRRNIQHADSSIHVYNYAQPRFANEALARHFDATLRYWRVTREDDPVPHVPTSDGGLLFPEAYYHFGSRVRLDVSNDGRALRIHDQTTAELQELRQLMAAFPVAGALVELAANGAANFGAHSMDTSYGAQLGKELRAAFIRDAVGGGGGLSNAPLVAANDPLDYEEKQFLLHHALGLPANLQLREEAAAAALGL